MKLMVYAPTVTVEHDQIYHETVVNTSPDPRSFTLHGVFGTNNQNHFTSE